jgi:hypothetical protein
MDKRLADYTMYMAMAADTKEEVNRLNAKIKEYESKAGQCKKSIRQEMIADGVESDKQDGFTLYLRKGSQRIDVNADACPDEFCRIKREPDKAAIKKHIDAGNIVNWATVQVGEPTLVIKVTGSEDV